MCGCGCGCGLRERGRPSEKSKSRRRRVQANKAARRKIVTCPMISRVKRSAMPALLFDGKMTSWTLRVNWKAVSASLDVYGDGDGDGEKRDRRWDARRRCRVLCHKCSREVPGGEGLVFGHLYSAIQTAPHADPCQPGSLLASILDRSPQQHHRSRSQLRTTYPIIRERIDCLHGRVKRVARVRSQRCVVGK